MSYDRLPRHDVEVVERPNNMMMSSSHPLEEPSHSIISINQSDSTPAPPSYELTSTIAAGESSSLDGLTQIKIIQIGSGAKPVHVDLDWTIEELKKRLFPEDVEKNRNIRVIFNGKLLANELHLSEVGIKSNSFLHISITDFQPASISNTSSSASVPNGIVVNNEVVLHGEHDLEAMVAEQARLERSHQEATRGSIGDFIVGFALGFVIGMIMVVWIWQPRLSKRQKLGILCGITAHLVLSYVNVDKNHPTTTDSSSSGSSSLNGN